MDLRSPARWLALPLLMLGSAAMAQMATGAATNVTPDQNRVNTRGSMSLNGQKIAYTYPSPAAKNQVWVMNSDGTGKKKVTWSVSDTLNSDTVAYEWPSLNADGTKLVMHVWDTGNSTEVVSVDLATGTATRLTNNAAYDAYAAYSPDGSKILFLSKRDNADQYQVYVMKAEPESATNVPVQLTTDLVGAKYARFTPDGLHIILGAKSSLSPDNYAVTMLDVAGGANLHLVAGDLSKDANEPSQMTVGGRIYFVANYGPDNKRHVYSCLPDGSGVRQVSGGDTDEYFAFAAGNKLMATFVDSTLGVTAATGDDAVFNNADIQVYSLSTTTGNGTLSGKVLTAPGQAAQFVSVEVFDGSQGVASLSPDASGAFSTSLPAGGYTVRVTGSGTPVVYGAVVASGGNSSRTTYLDETSAAVPTAVLPTITGANVDIRWTSSSDKDGVPVTGYNVYRSTSESGPWTKANSTPIAQSAMPTFLDTNPGNLVSAFYMVTTLASDGSSTIESAPSAVAQAANNLVFNPSFEINGPNGMPLGWRYTSWGGNATIGVDTTDKALGAQSAYQQSGDTAGWVFLDTAPPYSVPSAPGDKFINGMYTRLKNSTGGAYASSLFAFSTTEPDQGAETFYGWGDYTMVAFNDENHPWGWIGGWNVFNMADESTYTRLSCTFGVNGGGAATAGLSRAYYDEVRMQVRRVGATGVIAGRTIVTDGTGVSGVTITAAGQTTTSGNGGFFIFRNVPTGTVPVTATIAGKTVNQNVLNVGGARPDLVFTDLPALTISGTVYHSDGTTPAANANVMLAYSDGSAAALPTQRTTADANGHYTFTSPIKGAGDTAISAGLPDYAEGVTVKTLGLYGPATIDVNLGDLAPAVSVMKTATPPTIDGIVNASEWGASQVIPVTFGSASTIATKAYMLWDNTAIYIAFVGDEPNPAGMQARAAGPDDGTIWAYPILDSEGNRIGDQWNADDAYGVWLDANRGGCAGFGFEQLQLLCNSNQTNPSMATVAWRDYMPNTWDSSWNPALDWKANVDTTNKTYSVEIKIPYAGIAVGGIGAPTVQAGDYWRGRLNRHRNQPITNVTTGDGGMDWAATDTSWNTFRFVTSLVTKGDVNGDGSINNADVIAALKIAAGMESAGSRAAAGDVSADSKVSLEDAVKILRKVTGVAPVL